MQANPLSSFRRRALLLAALGSFGLACLAPAAAAEPGRPKIGIVGTGKIGGTLAELWAKAGYELLISSRHPDELKPLAQRLGPKVRVGTPQQAAAFGEVVLIAVPYGAMPQVGRDLAASLTGKVVLDTGNPFPQRDGPMAETARAQGAGLASAGFLPGVRLVRAFNSISAAALRSEAHRGGERIGVPLAADDADALKIAEQLVQDAGFEPVAVGPLARAKAFDAGTPVFGRALTAHELRQALGIAP